MDGTIGLRKLCDSVLLVLVVILIGKAHEVVASLGKLLRQVGTMGNASAENNRLARAAEHFMSFLHPLGNNVPGDLHASGGHFVLRPLTRHLFGAFHVNFFGDKNAQRHQALDVHKLLRGDAGNHVVVNLAQALCEGRGRQAHHTNLRVRLDELHRLGAGLVRLIYDQQLQAGEAAALLQRLRAAHLNVFVWAIAPVPRLHNTVVNAVLLQALAGLVAEHHAIKQHRGLAALLGCSLQQRDCHFRFACARRCHQNLRPVALCEASAQQLQNSRLVLEKFQRRGHISLPAS